MFTKANLLMVYKIISVDFDLCYKFTGFNLKLFVYQLN